MNKIKKVLRLIGLGMLIILAFSGMGFIGPLFPTNRDYETKPSSVERKDELSAEDDSGGVKE